MWSRAYAFPHTCLLTSFLLPCTVAMFNGCGPRPLIWAANHCPHYVIAVPCQGFRTDTCLHFFQDACNDVVGRSLGCGFAHQQLPRIPISKMLQEIGTFSSKPPGGPEAKYYCALGYGRNVNGQKTGGQEHTHTHTTISTTFWERKGWAVQDWKICIKRHLPMSLSWCFHHVFAPLPSKFLFSEVYYPANHCPCSRSQFRGWFMDHHSPGNHSRFFIGLWRQCLWRHTFLLVNLQNKQWLSVL